jgi:ISXO2 transposase-like protein
MTVENYPTRKAARHGAKEFARTDGAIRVTSTPPKASSALFKRAIVGVWYQISTKHLRRYASEHEFRWNRRHSDVADRIARCLIGHHGRLRWKELVA